MQKDSDKHNADFEPSETEDSENSGDPGRTPGKAEGPDDESAEEENSTEQ